MADQDRRKKLFEQLADVSQGFDVPSIIVLLDGTDSHVQVNVEGTEDPARTYEAGQKALFALAAFLERYRPAVEQAEHRKAQRS